MEKHPDAVAWDKWLAGEGKVASDPTTLGAEERMRYYLENRLWHAFMAGLEYGKQAPERSTSASER